MLKRIALLSACCSPRRAGHRRRTGRPRPCKIVVPFGAGSTPDVVARLIADQLVQKYPASAFVVENKPGASGNLGTDAVAKAAPDGATIGISIGGPLAINTLLFSKLPYDPQNDIAPITQLVTQPSALAVNPDAQGQFASPNWSRCSRPTRASTISPRSATARCRISPWRRSRSKPAPRWCTCPTRARRRR